MHKVIVSVLALAAALPLLACTSGASVEQMQAGAYPNAQQSPASKRQSLVDKCSGAYVCREESDDPFVLVLWRTNAGCSVEGKFFLDADGTFEAGDVDGTWTSTEKRIELCIDGTCASCMDAKDDNARDEAKTSGGTCVGTASSCEHRQAGSCGTQYGCEFLENPRVGADGDLMMVYECEGIATPCGTFTTSTSCAEQDGCSWR